MEDKSGLALPMTMPSLEDMQHWTRSIGQAQQLLMEYATGAMTSEGPLIATQSAAQTAIASTPLFFHPELLLQQNPECWQQNYT